MGMRAADGSNLRSWVTAQRTAFSKGNLAAERGNRLEALPGWSWDPVFEQWEEGFAHLQEFVARERHALVSGAYKTAEGFRLGGWVNRQRQSHLSAKLDADRFGRLAALKGWVWGQIQAQWDYNLTRLEEFAQREGHALMPTSYKTKDGLMLGSWCNTQRIFYRKGKLSAERIARLEALPGWVWKAAN